MGYVDEWKLIKKNFETATGRKKPSGTFLGIVSKSTGFEPLCKSLDSAAAAKDAAKMAKSAKEFDRKRQEYEATLVKAATGADKNLLAEIKVLHGELLQLGTAAAKQASQFDDAQKAREALETGWKAIAAEMVKSPLFAQPALSKFVSDGAVGTLFATKAASSQLKSHQAAVKSKVTAYKSALAAITKVKPAPANAKAFLDALHDAQDLLNVNGGAMHWLGEWSRVQRDALKGADRATLDGFNNWPAWTLRNQLNEALSAENERLGKLEQSFERQVQRIR